MTKEEKAAWTALYDAALSFMGTARDSPQHGDAEDRLTDALDTSLDFLTRVILTN